MLALDYQGNKADRMFQGHSLRTQTQYGNQSIIT